MKSRPPTAREIDELLAFLPRLTAEGFAPVREFGGGDTQADGAYVMPWPRYDPVVSGLFLALVQRAGINEIKTMLPQELYLS